jgi:outer membrane protein assembly factor BamB
MKRRAYTARRLALLAALLLLLCWGFFLRGTVRPRLLWATTLPSGEGEFKSLAGGVLFLGGYRGSDDATYALDAATGRLLWRADISPLDDVSVYGSTAVITEAWYGAGGGRTLYGVDLATGRPHWAVGTAGNPLGQDEAWPCVAYNGRLAFLSCYLGMHLVAVDTATGRLAWRRASPDKGAEAEGTRCDTVKRVPEYFEAIAAGKRMVAVESPFPCPQPHVLILDAETGRLRARYSLADSVDEWEFVVGKVVVFRDAGGRLVAYDVDKGKELWRQTAPAGATRSNGHGCLLVEFPDERGVCRVDMGTGRVMWRLNGRTDSVGMDQGKRVFVHDGRRMWLALDMRSGRRLWTYRVPTGCEEEGHCFFDAKSDLACIGAKRKEFDSWAWLRRFWHHRREDRPFWILLDARTGRRMGTFNQAGEDASVMLDQGVLYVADHPRGATTAADRIRAYRLRP